MDSNSAKTEIRRDASDEEVVEVVLAWVDVLASGNFEAVGAALGYSMEDGDAAECIRGTISSYRSPDLYPGERIFSVTDWRTASGGNPEPRQEVTWYEPNEPMLAGAITIDLPLNGKWSDLQADFVLKERGPEVGLQLRLEEIYSWRQRNREGTQD